MIKFNETRSNWLEMRKNHWLFKYSFFPNGEPIFHGKLINQYLWCREYEKKKRSWNLVCDSIECLKAKRYCCGHIAHQNVCVKSNKSDFIRIFFWTNFIAQCVFNWRNCSNLIKKKISENLSVRTGSLPLYLFVRKVRIRWNYVRRESVSLKSYEKSHLNSARSIWMEWKSIFERQ